MEKEKSDAERIEELEAQLAEYRERAWRAESQLTIRVALRKELEAALGFADGETYDDAKFAEAVKKVSALEAEVARLQAEREGGPLTGGDTLFLVTESGRAAMVEESPKPPKLTRSQQRYRRFLNDDTGLSFREWLDYERDSKSAINRSFTDSSGCY